MGRPGTGGGHSVSHSGGGHSVSRSGGGHRVGGSSSSRPMGGSSRPSGGGFGGGRELVIYAVIYISIAGVELLTVIAACGNVCAASSSD